MHAILKTGIALVAILTTPVVETAGLDLHWLWEDRCAECHGHAGQFSRKFLVVYNGELQGRHHIHDLRRFLHNHYLVNTEVDAVYNMLLAQANTLPRFKNECSSCHQGASSFVRKTLELRDGSLYSRKSGQLVQRFLEHHRGLDAEDIEFYTQLLMRVAHEVYRP
jgi:hypothetical protein